jgi:hypothetical protein
VQNVARECADTQLPFFLTSPNGVSRVPSSLISMGISAGSPGFVRMICFPEIQHSTSSGSENAGLMVALPDLKVNEMGAGPVVLL